MERFKTIPVNYNAVFITHLDRRISLHPSQVLPLRCTHIKYMYRFLSMLPTHSIKYKQTLDIHLNIGHPGIYVVEECKRRLSIDIIPIESLEIHLKYTYINNTVVMEACLSYGWIHCMCIGWY